jgi:hypothetical protein
MGYDAMGALATDDGFEKKLMVLLWQTIVVPAVPFGEKLWLYTRRVRAVYYPDG